MKGWTIAESSFLSAEVAVITLLVLHFCGFAFYYRMKEEACDESIDDRLEGTEAIFNSALRRFEIFVHSEEDDSKVSAEETNSISIEKTVDYCHQVAGHTCEVLRAFQGKVLKPMVKGRLFIRELRLYEKMAQCPHLTSGLPKSFVPNYIGLALVHNNRMGPDEKTFPVETLYSKLVKIFSRASSIPPEIDYINSFVSKKLLPHLVLDDLTLNYKSPCVIDIKMGQQTYEPDANANKKKREIRKCPYQVITGFRITGMKVYDVLLSSYSYKDKQFGRSVQPDEVTAALKLFFWNGCTLRTEVIISVIEQLKQILYWFEQQMMLHFYCSSILIIYDGCTDSCYRNPSDGKNTLEVAAGNERSSSHTDLVQVKMIDFAHTLPSPIPKAVDHGYILGIKNLISKLTELINM